MAPSTNPRTSSRSVKLKVGDAGVPAAAPSRLLQPKQQLRAKTTHHRPRNPLLRPRSLHHRLQSQLRHPQSLHHHLQSQPDLPLQGHQHLLLQGLEQDLDLHLHHLEKVDHLELDLHHQPCPVVQDRVDHHLLRSQERQLL